MPLVNASRHIYKYQCLEGIKQYGVMVAQKPHELQDAVRFCILLFNALKIISNALNDIYKTSNTCIIMNFIKSELDKEFSSIGLRNQRRNVKVLPQVKVEGTDISRDQARKALAAGKRISKTGKVL